MYDEILAHAENPVAAGFLHERLWQKLKAKEDPAFQHIRLTRGDGGLDGLCLRDPATGSVSAFQAKFFKEFTSPEHKDAVLKSFVTVLKNPFPIEDWCLLVPVPFSAKELGWLIGPDFKKEAKGLAAELELNHLADRIDSCEVHFSEGTHLHALCLRHIETAAAELPNSRMALLKEIKRHRKAASFFQKEVIARLDVITEQAVRQRRDETHKAHAALKIFNQGWADHGGMLVLAKDAEQMEIYARDLAAFAQSQSQVAFIAEGLFPGISEWASSTYLAARRLQANSLQLQIFPRDGTRSIPEELMSAAKALKNSIQQYQGEVSLSLFEYSKENKETPLRRKSKRG